MPFAPSGQALGDEFSHVMKSALQFTFGGAAGAGFIVGRSAACAATASTTAAPPASRIVLSAFITSPSRTAPPGMWAQMIKEDFNTHRRVHMASCHKLTVDPSVTGLADERSFWL